MKRECAWILGLLLLALGSSVMAVEPEEPSGKKALLIGISEYAHLKPLRGAANDVDLMASVLVGRYAFDQGNVRVLRNAAATREAILTSLAALVATAEPHDAIYVHFSGYGSQVSDQSGEELDQLDESLVPYDGRGGADDILDDEIEMFLRDIVKKTRNVTLTLDVCYRPRAARGGTQLRCIEPLDVGSKQQFQSSFRDDKDDFSAARSDIAILQAADRDSVANEARFDNGVHGALTYQLAEAMAGAVAGASFGEVLEQAHAQLSARFPTQNVSFDLRRYNAPPLFIVDARSQWGGVVSVLGDQSSVRLAAGRTRGFDVGQSVKIYAPDTRDFEAAEPIAEAQIERTSDTISMGTVSTASAIPPGSIAVVSDRDEQFLLTVWIDEESIGSRDRDALIKRLTRIPEVRVVRGELDGQIQISRSDTLYSIVSGDLVPLNEGLRSVDEVGRQVDEWASWYSLLEKRNPRSRLSIDLNLARMDGSDGPIRPGDLLEVTLTNTSDRPIYLQTWVFSTDGSADPWPSQKQRLEPNESHVQTAGTFLPDDRQVVMDYIKVFASDERFRIDSERAGRTRSFGRSLEEVDWTTAQVSYELRRQNTRVIGFAVHAEDASRSEPVAGTDGRRSICSPGSQSECVFGDDLNGDGTVIVIDRTLAPRSDDDIEPRDAFEEAYSLGESLGVDRVEPLFEAPFADKYLDFGARSGGDDDHDEAAARDRLWSVKYVRAPEAWQFMRDSLGKQAGAEAAGVRIAHLDTGYREHPEFYREIPPTVLPEFGLDLVDDGDPFDTLTTSGFLPNPGHGTVSGSTIVSPSGCQLANSKQFAPCVSGTGPGSQIVPVRVHTSVVVVNQRKLAKAITEVVKGNVRGEPRIISIAMGGPPSWSLWRAVRSAEKAGILIIAAAGNNVKVVVWPARFRSTIAAGAINVRCGIWSGSSEGSRVDISAPGQSVWHGYIDRNVAKKPRDQIGMGNGTTFATATTTGIAALWVAAHQGSSEFTTAVNAGTLTEAFRQAVKDTAWKPVGGDPGQPDHVCPEIDEWNIDRNGAGILNALALLQAPLDATAERSGVSDELSDLPMYSSLYPEGADRDQIVADYRGLFIRPDDTRTAIFEAEILYFYSMNETVRRAIDYTVEGNNEPDDYKRTREALLRARVSEALARALQ